MLRNRFNYKTIGFNEVHSATFVRAADTRSVPLALGAGVLFIFLALYNLIGVYENYHDPTVRTIYIESIVWPTLLLMGGSYCVYMSVKKTPLLIVHTRDRKYKLNLKDIVQAGQIPNLESYLNAKIPGTFRGGPIS